MYNPLTTLLLFLAAGIFLSACSDDSGPAAPVQPGPATSMEFVQIPAGVDPWSGDAIAAFEMGKYEVTQKEWLEVMRSNPSYFRGDTYPVHCVSWEDAQYFLDSLNARADGYTYRFPTEKEWEHACRAGSSTDYYTGNQTVYGCIEIDPALDLAGWYCANSGKQPHPCGEKEPNAFGLYDMHGNVPEWCEEWYNETKKVTKGGGYAWIPEWSRTTSKVAMEWTCGNCGALDQTFGFRVVRTKN